MDNIVGIIHLKQVLRLQQAGELDAEQFAHDPARAVLHSGGHAAADAAAAVPDRSAAPRARSRRVRRAAGPGVARGHPGGDRRRIHHPGARGLATFSSATRTAASSSTAWLRCARSTASSGPPFRSKGPKTLNGLIVEKLGEIPDAGMSFRLGGPGRRNPPGAGSRRESRKAAAARGARRRRRLYKAPASRHHR